MPLGAPALGPIPIPKFSIRINGTVLPADALADVIAITVQEDVEAPGMFTIQLYDWDADHLRVKWVDHNLFNEGNEVAIQMGYEADVSLATLMSGEITGLEPEFSPEGPPKLTVRGYDRRHRLLRGRKTRSFVQMKDSDIARQIASGAGLRPQVKDTKVKLEYVLQHNQTDLEFLQERARRIGYEVVVEDKTLHFRSPQHDKPATLTLSLDSDIAEFFPRLTTMTQVGQMEVHGWDPKQKQAIVARAGRETSKMAGSVTGPQAAQRAFGNTISAGVTQPVLSRSEADQMALGRFNEMALGYISAEGACQGGRPDLRAGTVVKIDGAGRRFSGLYYVTSTTHTITPEQGYRTAFTVKRNAT